MTHEDALKLLSPLNISKENNQWADLGAGSGTFSLALSELLGPTGVVHAVDKNTRALERIKDNESNAHIQTYTKDFTKPLGLAELDGILLANSLHFVKNQRKLLSELMLSINTGGQLAIIEYDIRRGNLFVPHAVPFEKLSILAEQIGLPQPKKLATHPSRYHREMYLATITIPEQLEPLN